MNFAIWTILESNITAKFYSSVATLKHALLASRSVVDEGVVRRLCYSVTSRLELVAKGRRRPFWNLIAVVYIIINKRVYPIPLPNL